MKITPRKGYILVSEQELPEETKIGKLILTPDTKKRTYLRVESHGEFYFEGNNVIIPPYKQRTHVHDNIFLIAEADIVANFVLEDNS